MTTTHEHTNYSRRDLLKALAGAGLAAGLPMAPFMPAHAANAANKDKRILVVLELSGANDGLNTLVPYADDAYYQLRPRIGIRADKVRKIDDHYGFNPSMSGFEKLYKDGRMAIIHGCGYEQPSFSHFTSMAYWHTGVPNGGEPYGWLGRVADAIDPKLTPNFLVNIDERQSLAVQSERHVPVVFDDPERFARKGLLQSRALLDNPVAAAGKTGSASCDGCRCRSRGRQGCRRRSRGAPPRPARRGCARGLAAHPPARRLRRLPPRPGAGVNHPLHSLIHCIHSLTIFTH